MIPLLVSLCSQIAFIYGQPKDEIPADELSPLVQHFKKLITFATAERPLNIVLDSLDQLSGADGGHSLAWSPTNLPENVKLIVSAIPSMYNLLETLQALVEVPENFVSVLPLGENLGGTILKFWLKNANRDISTEHGKS